jgi:hypothetical protein
MIMYKIRCIQRACLGPFAIGAAVVVCLNNFGCRLYQFNQDSIARNWGLIVPLGMNESYVMSRSSFSDTAGRESNSLRPKPIHCRRQIIHPKADVIQWGNVDLQGTNDTSDIDSEIGNRVMSQISSRVRTFGAFSGSIGHIRSISTA